MSKLNPQDREVLDNFTGMTVGQIFARARGNLGYSLEQIGTHLNIGTMHLQAIESDDAGNLPPKVYAVGFVRAYADVLGLDSEKMAYLFKVQCYGNTQAGQQDVTDAQGETIGARTALRGHLNELPFHIGSFFFIAISTSVVLVILATMVWLVWPRDKQDDQAGIIPPVPAEMTEIITIEPPIIEEITETPTAEGEEVVAEIVPTEPTDLIVKPDEGGMTFGGEATNSALVFKAVDASWIEIRVVGNNRILLSRTLNKGDVFYTPENTDIMLTTGNAAGLEMYLDGISLGIMGGQGEIIRMRPFSVESLRLQNTPETE